MEQRQSCILFNEITATKKLKIQRKILISLNKNYNNSQRQIKDTRGYGKLIIDIGEKK